jgi:PAS domain S-box-containing protein
MGEIEFVSRQTLEFFGKTKEELKDWSRAGIVHPDDLPRVIEAWRKSIETGRDFEVEHRNRRVDGVYRWIQARGRAVRTGEGEITGWYWLLTDIEDRKKAEEAVRVNERNLSLIVDSIPGLVVRMSATGEIELANRQLLAYFGKELEEIRDWTTSGVVHPEDLPRAVEVARHSFETGDPYEMEIRVRRHDGVYRWFQARAIPLRDAEGRILNWYALHTDIDDRKRVEEALRASEFNARMIVDGIPGLVARTSPAGEVEVVNRPLLEYFGKDLEEIRNWQFTDAIYPDDLPLAIETFSKLSTGHPFDVEHRLRRFDGVYRWFQSRGLPLRNPEGRILNWYVLLTDIEDRKEAEEALESNERNLSLIINTMPTLAWSARPDGSAEFLNQHYLDYVGLPFERLQGWGWTAAVHPEDLNALSGAWQSIMAAGQPGEAEARLRRFDGEFRWFLFRTNPMRDESGQIVKWYGTNTDIHDRKRAEAELKESYLRLTEAQRLSKTGSFITDLVADNHDWSEETYRIFEFDPGTKVSVQMIRDRIHPEDLPSFDSMIARAMTGKDVDFSFRFVTARGPVKHIRGMARVIEHIVGRPLFIGALQDVTENKLAEEALNKARSDLAHVSRVTTLNALTASIAHEINQPLSGIITNASTGLFLLSADPPDLDGARETAQRTIRDGNRASDVVARLRALYSKKDPQLESMDLNEATREVISLSLSDLQRNRVILRLELADNLPPVTGDRIQLQQVILNLVRNASDAMGTVYDRPRELQITTELDTHNQVCLSVKDVGIGFEPQTAAKLFEAFYTTKEHGMGIGLHVSRSIVEAHHGRMWATANDGPGAIFSFAIPCSLTGTESSRQSA